MIRFLVVEVRRTMRRREVWLLLLAGLTICVIAGVVAFVDSAGKEFLAPDDPRFGPGGGGRLESEPVGVAYVDGDTIAFTEEHPAAMRTWWSGVTHSGIVLIISTFSVLGAVIGGAMVVGGEWKAGTVANVLLWEPRRLRVGLSRVLAVMALAFGLAVAIHAVFLVSLLPAVLINGTTAGTGGAFWSDLAAMVVRVGAVSSLAAGLAAGAATITRSSAAALLTILGWAFVVENVVRARWPRFGDVLLLESVGVLISGQVAVHERYSIDLNQAAFTVSAYVLVVVALGMVTFSRREVPARA